MIVKVGGVDQTNRLNILKKSIEKNGSYYLSDKKTTSDPILQYMFQQLLEGLQKNRFLKNGNFFILTIKTNIVIVETLHKHSTVYRAFKLENTISNENLITNLKKVLILYDLIIIPEKEKIKRNPKLITIQQKYLVEFAENT